MRGGGGPGVGAARVIGSGGRSVGARIGEGAPCRGWGGWVLIQVASLIVLQTMEVMLRTSWIMNESFVLSLSGRTGR